MRKILWHSVAPFCPTGYGNQTNLFAPRIAALDDVDLAISSGYGLSGHHMKFAGITVYPGEDWNRTVLQWANHHGRGEPVTVITLMDVWPLDRQIFATLEQQGRLACWCPVDHKPVPTQVLEFLETTKATPIAMSLFGQDELRNAGLDPLYVPHGVDTDMFKPRDRTEIREMWNIDPDAFVVGMVANNQGQALPRKAFSEAFAAFSLFREQHEDAILYLHCEMSGFRQGIDLDRLITRSEIPPEAIKITDQVLMEFGIPAGVMDGLYNVFDVLLSPSYGEGFGVPIIEAQACGTPVIVTDWTAMPELCGAGWLVDGTIFDHPMAEAFWKRPDVDGIVDALEKAYVSRGDQEIRDRARAFALDYDVNHVMAEYWIPALERIHAPREVQPLKPNRAMRRAAGIKPDKADIVIPELVQR
jgi:glycosyltransferase involved in cell wall biosynthesis